MQGNKDVLYMLIFSLIGFALSLTGLITHWFAFFLGSALFSGVLLFARTRK